MAGCSSGTGGLPDSSTSTAPTSSPGSTVTTTVMPRPVVVLDPGHGGAEPGAIGPSGLKEKEVNLDVARRAAHALLTEGVEAVLTRSADHCETLGYRVTFAARRRPELFVSIHHNAEPDGPSDGPGSETYFQYRSPESKRLAGILYEEISAALRSFPAQWVADTDAGAKWRLNDRDGDYYGVLRLAGDQGMTASLVEYSFISNPSEEALLRREDVRQAEAEALARGILRYLRTPDAGSGFTTPYPRSSGSPAPRSRCIDPSL